MGILLVLSCEEERDTKYPKIMQGQVDFSIPEPAVAGRELSFQVSNGIIDPDKNLTFEWSAPDFNPATYSGAAFLTVSPATPGIYPIFLTVRAAGYRDIVIKNDVKLELAHCTPMMGSLRIEGPSGAYMNEEVVFTAAGIAAPEEQDLEYRWTTSGGFTPGTFIGKEFHTQIGATPNTYTVYLEAVDTKGRYCPSDTSKAVSNACTPMTGTLEFAAEPTGYIITKGSTVKLAADGIQTPSTGVRYVWSLPGFESIAYLTIDSSVVSVWAPSNVYGEREVTVTAQAAGYCPVTQAHVLKIVDCIPMEGQLKLTLNGTRDETTGAFRQGTLITASASGITTPANLLYEWTTSPNIPATPTTNNTWSATLPNTVDNYTLTAKAKAAVTSINYCEVSKDTVISVGTVRMAGDLFIETSGDAVTDGRTLRPGSPVQFVAKGIAYPPVENITYEWSVTGLSVTPPPPTVARDVWSFPVPASAADEATYTVKVVASAVGYSSQQYTVTGTVKRDMMTGALQLQFSGDGVGTNSEGKNTLRPGSEVTFMAAGITAPLTGLSYTWDWRVTNASAPAATEVTVSPVNSWKITAPGAIADTYTARVNVEATGYNPAIQTVEFIIDNTIMSGNLQIQATGDDEEVTDAADKITVRPGADVLFDAKGITAPANVTYEWAWKGAALTSPATATGAAWDVAVPNNAQGGNYYLVVTAKAAGYKDKVTEKPVVVKAADMGGTLNIKVNGLLSSVPDTIRPGMEISFEAAGITKPTNNLTYEWEWGLIDATTPSETNSKTNDNTWKITAGATGHYVVKVTVKSYGYEPYPVSKAIIVKAPEMVGDLTVKADGAGVSGNTLRPAANITFTVDGVTNPATGVQYDWSVQYNSDAAQTYTDNGKTLDFQIPSSTLTGSYTVSVTARATGYTDLAGAKRTFTVATTAMAGTLTVQASGEGVSGNNTLRPAANITFTVDGVTNPATGVTYDWSVQYNSDAAQTYTDNGKTLDFEIPSSTLTGSYTVSVTARATGYTDLAGAKRVFTVATTPMTGNLDIQADGEGVSGNTLRPATDVTFKVGGVTNPTTGVKYDWLIQHSSGVSQSFPDKGTAIGFPIPAATVTGSYTVSVTARATGYTDLAGANWVFTVATTAMTGTLTVQASGEGVINGSTLRPASKVTFKVDGVTTPAAGVTYDWTVKYNNDPSPTTFPNHSKDLDFFVPSTATGGNYTVWVTAKAAGYSDWKSVEKIFAVNSAVMTGDLAIQAEGEGVSGNTLRPASNVTFKVDGVTTPAASVTYDWSVQYNSDAAQTYTGNSKTLGFTVPAATVTGSYTVSVTARATGYTDLVSQRIFTVTPAILTGRLEIAVNSTAKNTNGSIRPGATVEFQATGLTGLPADAAYNWVWTPPSGAQATASTDTWTTNSGTAEGVGTVTVTVQADGYAGMSAQKTVTVEKGTLGGMPEVVVVTSSPAANQDGSFRPGSKVQFRVDGLSGLPADATYSWTWTPPSGVPATTVTTVNTWTTGIGTAVGDGTVAVTVQANGYAGQSAQKTVTVEKGTLSGMPKVVVVTSVPAANQDSSFRPGSQVQFRVDGLTNPPNGTQYAWTWTPPSGAPTTVTTDNTWTTDIGTAVGAGTVAVTVQAEGYGEKSTNLPVDIQKTTMRGALTIVPTGTMRTIDNTLCFLPGSIVRFTANMTNPPAGVTYEWKIKNNGGGGAETTATGSPYDYTATLLNTSSDVIGDILNIKLTVKADGYADKEVTMDAKIRCFPFVYTEAVPKITYTSGGGSTIYTGAEVIFTAPVISNPDNGANATYTWLATTSSTGTGRQWTTPAPATPTNGFGAAVTIKQTGYCTDTRSLPGLSVNCQPESGVLTANVEGKSIGDIYFNKAQDLKLWANYNGTAGAESYTWNIGGQYEQTTNVANHTIQANDPTISALSTGTYTLTVKAMKGACTLQTVSYNIYIIDCPYTGSDLLIDADHECKEITTSSSTYYQAHISAGTQTYRIVRLPPTSTNLWWFAENSKLGNRTHEENGVYYYVQINASGACPSEWGVPTSSQWSAMISGVGATASDGKVLCNSTDFTTGTDLWGFSATNTHYYNGSSMDNSEGAFIWASDTNTGVEIRPGKAATTTSSSYGYTVRCIRQ
jgi:uncharacterized protein (TIGR02145 family)